ncbi:MAG: hypothetical protein EBR86_14245, partial [Planctomycetia bacterium]|nr:hypothetical protein [Planctomycetia bacterium]
TSLLQTWAARRAVLEEVRSSANGLAEVLARSVALAAEVPRAVEGEIGEQMLTQARLLAEVVALAGPPRSGGIRPAVALPWQGIASGPGVSWMSLRSRIALIAGVLVLASIAVTSLLQTWAARRAVLEEVRSSANGLAEVLARSVAARWHWRRRCRGRSRERSASRC